MSMRKTWTKNCTDIAAHEGHLAVVSLLLDRGANVNARSEGGGTALIVAAWRRSPEVVQALLNRGADVNAGDMGGVTPFDDGFTPR